MKPAAALTRIVAASALCALAFSQTPTKAGPSAIYPDPKQTPGKTDPANVITQANLKTTVCSTNWTGTNRYTHQQAKGTEILRPPVDVTDKIKVQTMKSYSLTKPSADYELDHFISLELGGCPDCIENLWPQAYGDSTHPMTQVDRDRWDRANPGDKTILPGSAQKDQVEDHLKSEMCAGTITLARAQQIITTDWYACYQKLTASPASPCR